MKRPRIQEPDMTTILEVKMDLDTILDEYTIFKTELAEIDLTKTEETRIEVLCTELVEIISRASQRDILKSLAKSELERIKRSI